MSQLIIEGDPKLVSSLDDELLKEFAAQGLADQVTVETKTVHSKAAPGELGFGEEVKQILVGFASVLKAGGDAIPKLAEGIANRIAQDRYDVEFRKDGIRIRARTSDGKRNIVELAMETRKILETQGAQP